MTDELTSEEKEAMGEDVEEVSSEQDGSGDNSIYIGKKAFMNYVTGVVMQFTTKDAEEVVIKARGKFISRAVDVAEVATKRFLENEVEVKNIDIGSEEFTNDEGNEVRVSSIEITLGRQ